MNPFALLAAAVLVQTPSVPPALGYQGRLLKTDGTPESGVVPMSFRLYDGATGGAALGCDDHQVALTDGFYSVVIGAGTPCAGGAAPGITPALFTGRDLWLELVLAGVALAPRQRITSVAYAFRAGLAQSAVTATDADTLDGVDSTAFLRATSSISASQIAGQIGDSQIAGVSGSKVVGTISGTQIGGAVSDSDKLGGLPASAYTRRIVAGPTTVQPGASLELVHNYGAVDYLALGYINAGTAYLPVGTAAVTALFLDSFARPDSTTVGNGWIETSGAGSPFGNDGAGTGVTLQGNSMLTGGGFAGTPETAATIIVSGHATQDLRITWRFKETGGNGDTFNLAVRRPTAGTYAVLGQGYGIQLTVNTPNGTACIVDAGACVGPAVSVPGFSQNVESIAELLYRKDGSVEGRGWPSSGSRPLTPLVSLGARTPTATGDAMGIDSMTGATSLFEVRPVAGTGAAHLELQANRAQVFNDGVSAQQFILVVAH